MFSLDFSNKAKKYLHKCDSVLRERIIDKIEQLKDDPVPHNAVSVSGEEKTFRIRIGDQRVLYKVKWNEKIILVAKIDKRPRAYQ